jgi:hypothetical protein
VLSVRCAVVVGALVPLALAGSARAPAALAVGIPATGAPTLGPDNIVPAEFSARVTNPWFPLSPGSVYRYRGVKDGRNAVEILRVTHRVKRILGAPAVVVRDRLYLDGELSEDTVDWYTQDRRGNVWYLGEATAELENGKVVSREGSFQAGVAGARGGIVMPAAPKAGQEFKQELFPGHAEDRFRIVDLAASVTVPYVSSRRALRTTEWTPLEPTVVDAKFYVRGVGTVKEMQVKGSGPREQLVLVSITLPAVPRVTR